MSFLPHLRLAAIAALSTFAFAAHAADVQVSCEKRSNRSKISIDGNNLASGSYRAVAKSGTRTATSDFATTAGDEVEFDFDSRAGEVTEVELRWRQFAASLRGRAVDAPPIRFAEVTGIGVMITKDDHRDGSGPFALDLLGIEPLR